MADDLNDQDFYKEFKDRMNMDPLEEVIKSKKAGTNVLIIIFAVITGILISSLIGWYVIGNLMVSKTGNINSLSDIPTIRRVTSQVKIKPDDEGGMKIANQEKQVYDLIGKNNKNKRVVKDKVIQNKTNVIAPSEEEYIDTDPTYEEDEGKDEIGEVIKEIERKSAAEKNPNPVKTESPQVKEESPAKINKANAETQKNKETVKVALKENTLPVTAKPVSILPKETVKTETSTAKNEANAEIFRVQVISAKDEKQAQTALQNLIKKIPEIKPLPNEIKKVDLGKKGVYYRLRVGSYKTREEAETLCGKLKAKGQDCIISK